MIEIKEANRVIELVLKDKTFLKNIAKMQRMYFDELIRVGFKEEHAVTLCSSLKPALVESNP